MSLDGPESWQKPGPIGQPSVDVGPLGLLPSLTHRQVMLGLRLGPEGARLRPEVILGALSEVLGVTMAVSRFGVDWRGSGLNRPGAIAQLSWPRLATRVGLGIEPALAHVLVDRLLGFERLPAEGRLQVTPVEWGILSFVVARGLDHLDLEPGPLGDWDLTLDRVGPDPFDPTGLGPIVTWRWRVQVGETTGSARLWIPETLLSLWLMDDPPGCASGPIPLDKLGGLSSHWVAESGLITLKHGLARLHPGLLLLIDDAPLSGSPANPVGPIALAQSDRSWRSSFQARAALDTHAARLILVSPLSREPIPRETRVMTLPADPLAKPSASFAPADVPVTLTVELGRVNLTLHRLADLKPGDVLELGRHAREPVELTSGGRLIARGELVQVDAELGVRVTQVFL